MSMNRSRPATSSAPLERQFACNDDRMRATDWSPTDTWRNDVGETTSSEKAFDGEAENLGPCGGLTDTSPEAGPQAVPPGHRNRAASRRGRNRRRRGGAAAAGERPARPHRPARDRPSPLRKAVRAGKATTERGAKRRSHLLNTLTAALNVHEAIEEKVLYPALKPHAEAHDIVLEGYQEHHVADLIIRELHQLAKNDEKWGAKFKVLEENIAHHIEEEERKMFPTARAVLTTEELNELGARMKALKAKLEKRNGGP